MYCHPTADRELQVIIENGWKGLPGGNLSQFWLDTIDCSNSDLKQILIDNVCKGKLFMLADLSH